MDHHHHHHHFISFHSQLGSLRSHATGCRRSAVRYKRKRLVQHPAGVRRLSAFTAFGTRTAADAGPPELGSTFKKNDKKMTKKGTKKSTQPRKIWYFAWKKSFFFTQKGHPPSQKTEFLHEKMTKNWLKKWPKNGKTTSKNPKFCMKK